MTTASPAATTMALEQSFRLRLPNGENAGRRTTGKLVEQLADNHCPLLIIGEAGTGKRELVERIHEASKSKRFKLRTVHGSTATVAQLETALKGPGTVYLESVPELSRAGQNFMLGQACLGHNLEHCSENEGRVICGSLSLQLLGEAVRAGKMREEFYYAIAGVALQIVPLRHRQAELIALAEAYLESAAAEMNKKKPVLNAEFQRFLLGYSWPGNLPELQSAMRACVLIGDQEIALAALQASVNKLRAGSSMGVSLKEVARTASMKAEREIISEALNTTGGNRKQAARDLKISYKALLYKLKRIGLEQDPA